MEKEWKNAVKLLCSIVQNRTNSMEHILEYIALTKDVYGLGEDDFRRIYQQWVRTGEILSLSVKTEYTQKREIELHARTVDGLCKMLHEDMIDEETFEESLCVERYRTAELSETAGERIAGFYPHFPGCIGYADDRESLNNEMKKSLRMWIRSAYVFWKEKQIINQPQAHIYK